MFVRSANDSKDDCEKYKSRAHAVLPKRSFAKQSVLESVALVWASHFGLPEEDEDVDAAHDPVSRVIETDLIDAVSSLLKAIDVGAAADWQLTRKHLHRIKGELLSMPLTDASQVDQIAASIDQLRHCEATPQDIEARWMLLRQAIESVLEFDCRNVSRQMSSPSSPQRSSFVRHRWSERYGTRSHPPPAGEPAECSSANSSSSWRV